MQFPNTLQPGQFFLVRTIKSQRISCRGNQLYHPGNEKTMTKVSPIMAKVDNNKLNITQYDFRLKNKMQCIPTAGKYKTHPPGIYRNG